MKYLLLATLFIFSGCTYAELKVAYGDAKVIYSDAKYVVYEIASEKKNVEENGFAAPHTKIGTTDSIVGGE